MKEKPSEVKAKLERGEITPQQAIELFKGTHQVTPVVYQGMEKPRAIVNLSRVGRELFNHDNADRHYEQRMDLGEGIRHVVSLPIYVAVEAVDGVVEALSYGVTEIVEDATFLASRTIYRARDGFNRGKIK